MNPPAPAPSSTTASALSAFLRGIERRAYVLALGQCGESVRAMTALAQAMRAFRAIAPTTPLSAWPASFWSVLLAEPELTRNDAPASAGIAPELRALTHGPRAALLLRLVAGLDFAHASRVLGVSEVAYRYASQRALQQLGHAGVSYGALAALRERLHRQIKALPEADQQALAALRERVLADLPEPVPSQDPMPSGHRRWLWIALAVLGLAFAATYIPPGTSKPLATGESQALPADAPPPASLGDTDIVTHPDYELLAYPAERTLAADLALLSWLAGDPQAFGTAPAAPPERVLPPARPVISAATGATLPDSARPLLAALASTWPSLDEPTRQRLLANAAHWQQLGDDQRTALRKQLSAWDAQPATWRASQRAALLAWQRLGPDDQQRLRSAVARLTALPVEQQQALRDAFDALPADQRQDWWLGPEMGAGFAELRPLFAYVPEAERPDLINLLGGLSPRARKDLALLAWRLPAEAREQLRQALLEQPADQREAWIRDQLSLPPAMP